MAVIECGRSTDAMILLEQLAICRELKNNVTCLGFESAFADQPPATDQGPIVNGNRHGRNKMAAKRSGPLFDWFMLDELLKTIM
ncbi:hypothetical protein J6590_064566 [Homalodisca vitripennis]|nr:hypothetical protein J6590_064566 [Homalodisca vitripennis]